MENAKITIKKITESANLILYELYKGKKSVGAARIKLTKNHIILVSLVVFEEYRKQGYGSAILKYIEEDNKKHYEYIILTLNVLSDNFDNLIDFYEKNGYKFCGIFDMKKNLKRG